VELLSQLHPIFIWKHNLSIALKITWKIFSKRTMSLSHTQQLACNNGKWKKISQFCDQQGIIQLEDILYLN